MIRTIFLFILFISCNRSRTETGPLSKDLKNNGPKNKDNLNIIPHPIIFTSKINPALPLYKFIIPDEAEDSRDFKVHAVEIYKDSTHIQTLSFDTARWDYLERSPYTQMIDLNFDGYLDLRVLDNAGATGNNWYFTWLYDPAKKKFIYDKQLSELSAVKVDSVNKEIISYERGGWCAEYICHLKLSGKKYIPVEIEETETDSCDSSDGCKCFKMVYKVKNNRKYFVSKTPLHGSLDKRR